jgi:hypothetical protein
MLRLLCVALLAVALGGCAALNTLHSEVSTFGPWPAERKPANFVFERLPSQQQYPQHQQLLEDAARGALEAAGFRAAADPNDAQYLIQLGARVTTNDPWIYNEPLFWRGHWRYGTGRWAHPFWGLNGGFGYPYAYSPSFEREVALLIRDRRTGQLMYEARADTTGPSAAIDRLLPAMFEAAMKDFPATGPNPRDVTTQISKR